MGQPQRGGLDRLSGEMGICDERDADDDMLQLRWTTPHPQVPNRLSGDEDSTDGASPSGRNPA